VPTEQATATLTATSAPLGTVLALGRWPLERLPVLTVREELALAAWLGRHPGVWVWPQWAPRMWEDMPAAWRN
jgi:hypothetical protein